MKRSKQSCLLLLPHHLKTVSDPNKLHILLVEDNREIRQFLQKELQAAYTISQAYHGEEALEMLKQENIQRGDQ